MLYLERMKEALRKWSDVAYTATRIVAGFMLPWHGMQKLFGVLTSHAFSFGEKPQLWIGGLIELVCGIAIAAGIFTRWAALLASGTMAVAFFQFHVGSDWSPSHILPIVNKGELAALYSFVFLYIATKGPGRASLDRVFGLDE
jgi:putative oxidoreductase